MAAKKKAKKRAPTTKSVGRPTLYQDRYVGDAYRYCLMGATDEELADAFGVATSTLYEWKNQYPEFSEAIKEAKHPADASVVGALHQRATGAEWVEEQAIKLKEVTYENGKRVKETERVEVVPVTRRVPPDTTAGIFWVKNRRKNWRDKQDIEHSGTVVLDQILAGTFAGAKGQ